jgi:RNA polymerase sigma factor (sigma-70 family)
MNPRLVPILLTRRSSLRQASDEQLAELVRAGSEAAFEALVLRHRAGLQRRCARVLSTQDSEEAVQESLLKAHAALTSGSRVRAVGPWLHTIAQNTAISMVRARASRPTAAEVECECAGGTEGALEDRLALRDLVDAIGGLPERQREAIVMRELEGRSYRQIAATLETSDGAVRLLISRARSAIRRRMAPAGLLEPVLRILGSSDNGVGAARVGALSGGCAVTLKVCATAVLPAAGAGLAVLDRPAARTATVTAHTRPARPSPASRATAPRVHLQPRGAQWSTIRRTAIAASSSTPVNRPPSGGVPFRRSGGGSTAPPLRRDQRGAASARDGRTPYGATPRWSAGPAGPQARSATGPLPSSRWMASP